MLKYVSKFTMDILPSVVATIVGAYIVNHYIVAKPGAYVPGAGLVSSADPKADVKNDAKPSGTAGDVANIPEPGVKAKGISEKAMLEKTAAEKPAMAEKPAEKAADKPAVAEKSSEKSAEKPAETASIPVETRRHQPAPREKAIARSVPAPVQPAVAPVIAAPNAAPPVEAAIAPEEHRDANDLARAAIERLRGASEGSPRAQEAARVPDTPRVASAPPVALPVVAAPPVRPLPPPIMVSSPSTETFDPAPGPSQIRPSYPAAAGIEDSRRPTPPADIPQASSPSPSLPPLDLRAEAVEPARRERTTVGEDMLLAAKSVFQAVLPK
jgi:hypothetical protein